MALVGKKTERHDVPGEQGQWVEFRELSGAERDEAQRAAFSRIAETAKGSPNPSL